MQYKYGKVLENLVARCSNRHDYCEYWARGKWERSVKSYFTELKTDDFIAFMEASSDSWRPQHLLDQLKKEIFYQDILNDI